MTKIVTATEDEAMKLALEGNEIILGGVEVHVRFVRYKGDPGISLEFTPPYGKDDVPDWMEDIDNRLAGLCRQTVMNMTDHARTRLLRLVEQDGGKDRMIYRLVVTSRIMDDGSHENRVDDYIDPEFGKVDRGVAGRAAEARLTVERVMGGESVTNLFAALIPEAEEELVRDYVIELITVIVRAVPDPDRPDDRLTMKIAAEIYDEFAPGKPGIDLAMADVRKICEAACDDVSIQMQDTLLVVLNRRRKDLDGLRQGKIGGYPVAYLADPQIAEFLGTAIKAASPEVTVWSLAWTVAMDDDGKLVVDCEDPFSDQRSVIAVRNVYDDSVFAEDWDHETREKIRQRIRKVNEVAGRIIREYMD